METRAREVADVMLQIRFAHKPGVLEGAGQEVADEREGLQRLRFHGRTVEADGQQSELPLPVGQRNQHGGAGVEACGEFRSPGKQPGDAAVPGGGRGGPSGGIAQPRVRAEPIQTRGRHAVQQVGARIEPEEHARAAAGQAQRLGVQTPQDLLCRSMPGHRASQVPERRPVIHGADCRAGPPGPRAGGVPPLSFCITSS